MKPSENRWHCLSLSIGNPVLVPVLESLYHRFLLKKIVTEHSYEKKNHTNVAGYHSE